jgi:hypothetical protein
MVKIGTRDPSKGKLGLATMVEKRVKLQQELLQKPHNLEI